MKKLSLIFTLCILCLFSLQLFCPASSMAKPKLPEDEAKQWSAVKWENVMRDWGTQELKRYKKDYKKWNKKLKRKVKNALTTNIGKAAELQQEVLFTDRVLTALNRLLKDRLRFGACKPNKTKFKIYLENDSKHSLMGQVYYGTSGPESMTIASGTVKKLKGKMWSMEVMSPDPSSTEYSSTFYALINLFVSVNGANVSWVQEIRKSTWKNKKKPCVFKFRYRVSDSDFPAPALKYAVYGIELGPYTKDTLYIGSSEVLDNMSRCDFAGGGNNCSIEAEYTRLSSTVYSTKAAAEQDLCRGIVFKNPWNSGSCNRWFRFRDGKEYWGCESSINKAVDNYCSKFNGSGKIYGTVVK